MTSGERGMTSGEREMAERKTIEAATSVVEEWGVDANGEGFRMEKNNSLLFLYFNGAQLLQIRLGLIINFIN